MLELEITGKNILDIYRKASIEAFKCFSYKSEMYIFGHHQQIEENLRKLNLFSPEANIYSPWVLELRIIKKDAERGVFVGYVDVEEEKKGNVTSVNNPFFSAAALNFFQAGTWHTELDSIVKFSTFQPDSVGSSPEQIKRSAVNSAISYLSQKFPNCHEETFWLAQSRNISYTDSGRKFSYTAGFRDEPNYVVGGRMDVSYHVWPTNNDELNQD